MGDDNRRVQHYPRAGDKDPDCSEAKSIFGSVQEARK